MGLFGFELYCKPTPSIKEPKTQPKLHKEGLTWDGHSMMIFHEHVKRCLEPMLRKTHAQ